MFRRTMCTPFVLALALSALPVGAQPVHSFSSLDRDSDRVLGQAEFGTLGDEIFTFWDTDRDGNIDEAEFYMGVHDLWDVDGDDALTLSEYDEGWSDWFGAPYYVTFTELDTNADEFLSADEFRTGLATTRVYDRWTYDGALGEEEFVTALYSVYDADSDGVLTQEEFSDIGYTPS